MFSLQFNSNANDRNIPVLIMMQLILKEEEEVIEEVLEVKCCFEARLEIVRKLNDDLLNLSL